MTSGGGAAVRGGVAFAELPAAIADGLAQPGFERAARGSSIAHGVARGGEEQGIAAGVEELGHGPARGLGLRLETIRDAVERVGERHGAVSRVGVAHVVEPEVAVVERFAVLRERGVALGLGDARQDALEVAEPRGLVRPELVGLRQHRGVAGTVVRRG